MRVVVFRFNGPCQERFVYAPITKVHDSFNIEHFQTTVNHAPGSLTRDDQIGRSDSVEQAHCTLGAVKRCRALSEGDGLPNFWFIIQMISLKMLNILEQILDRLLLPNDAPIKKNTSCCVSIDGRTPIYCPCTGGNNQAREVQTDAG